MRWAALAALLALGCEGADDDEPSGPPCRDPAQWCPNDRELCQPAELRRTREPLLGRIVCSVDEDGCHRASKCVAFDCEPGHHARVLCADGWVWARCERSGWFVPRECW